METKKDHGDSNLQILFRSHKPTNSTENNLNLLTNANSLPKHLENHWRIDLKHNETQKEKVEGSNTMESINLPYTRSFVKVENENSDIVTDFEAYGIKSPTLISNFDVLESPSSPTTIRISEILKADRLMSSQNVPKKRGRKKMTQENLRPENSEDNGQASSGTMTFQTTDSYQNVDSKQIEVIKAAKSLFSKRTRTLYHWMYPNAPKQQLKTAVANSWETLGVQEKQFYISQVLGRFGFPQCSLMVNPQLGCIRTVPSFSPLPSNLQSHEETRSAVSSILLNDSNSDLSWPTISPEVENRASSSKRKVGRPPGSKNKRQRKDVIKIMQDDGNPEEFQDDPELCREFQQFKWALHMTDEK